MSGGSYNYLCYIEASEIGNRISDLRDMQSRLAELGHLDAAEETEELLLIWNQFITRAAVRIRRLECVWKAVEWRDSGDIGDEELQKAVDTYRGDISTPSHERT